MIGAIGVASVFVAAVLILRVFGDRPILADDAWHAVIATHRSPILEVPSLVLDAIGGTLASVLVALAAAIILLARRRPWAAAYIGVSFSVAAVLSSVIKQIGDRPRPSDIIVSANSGSFPSGHVTYAAVLVVSFALLAARTWPWIVGALWVTAMAFSRTYLAAHWLSDTVGGAVLGASVALLVWPVARRARERITEMG
ncbi:MAG TPA: phosphoesterase PA-phosphatase [Microbacteriaceae bacterium]|jgi:undecaprenyl-diphosphatase|nr:phosphoesterase PA-phosphatase [Microbacteriaceae bacterium]